MPKVINTKPQEQIHVFHDVCGRCGGTGHVNPMGLPEPGLCPVCKGEGHSSVFESEGPRTSGHTTSPHYADGISVTSSPGRRR